MSHCLRNGWAPKLALFGFGKAVCFVSHPLNIATNTAQNNVNTNLRSSKWSQSFSRQEKKSLSFSFHLAASALQEAVRRWGRWEPSSMTQRQKRAYGSQLQCLCKALENFLYSTLSAFCNVAKMCFQVSWRQERMKVKMRVKTSTSAPYCWEHFAELVGNRSLYSW